jgi:hypothetical protein
MPADITTASIEMDGGPRLSLQDLMGRKELLINETNK